MNTWIVRNNTHQVIVILGRLVIILVVCITQLVMTVQVVLVHQVTIVQVAITVVPVHQIQVIINYYLDF